MAERDQLVRTLCRHDRGDAGSAEHVALLGIAREHEFERLRRHHHAAPATATRSVADFADTSTMRASPPRPRWLSLTATVLLRRTQRGDVVAFLAANERARRGLDVVLPHQALAHEEGRNPDGGEIFEVGGRGNSALADGDAVCGNSRRQAPAGGERRLEGLRLRLLTPMSRERSRNARSSSRSSCTSIRTSISKAKAVASRSAPSGRRPPP
jgi:hypothetical protein